jgi:hypothetical protein
MRRMLIERLNFFLNQGYTRRGNRFQQTSLATFQVRKVNDRS